MVEDTTGPGPNPVLLLGVDRLLGLQLARILAARRIPVVGAAFDEASHYCRSRAIARVTPVSRIHEEPVTVMRELAREFGAAPVLIPCLDEEVWWLNEHRDLLETEARFLLAPVESLELLADKGRFYRHALEHGLPIAPTRFVTDEDELEVAAASIAGPVIVKPPRRSAEWMESSGGFKVLRVERGEELLELGRRTLPFAGELVVQDWIDGGDDCMYSVYVCLDEQSRPAMEPVVARKLRQWPPDIGVGSLVVQVREDELVATTLAILQRAGYVGTGSLQFKRDPGSGRFFLIEMNTRFALCFPLCEACGLDATLTHYCLAAGLPLPEGRAITRPGARWICWKRDLASALAHWRRGDLTPLGWWRSLRGRKRSADLSLRDPMPTLLDVGSKLLRGPSHAARKTLSRRGR